MGFQLLLHELVQHFLRKKRLLVAKGLPDEDQGGDGLPPGVKPEGYEPPALTVKLMALMKFERTCEGRSNDPS